MTPLLYKLAHYSLHTLIQSEKCGGLDLIHDSFFSVMEGYTGFCLWCGIRRSPSVQRPV